MNVGGNEKYIQDFCGKILGKINLEHQRDGRLKLRWNGGRLIVIVRGGSTWFRMKYNGKLLYNGTESSGSATI